MLINRREFIGIAGSATASLVASHPLALAADKPSIKAIAFDAFPIFDPRPIFALSEEFFPGHGTELSNQWRIRQFDYAWWRALSGHYADFWQVTQDSLVYAAHLLKLELSLEKRNQLMEAYLNLKPWPDVLPALKLLRNAGIRLAILSNFTPGMLASGIKNSGLQDTFEAVLSTDQVKTFKPDPRAYQMGVDSLKLKREEIAFAAFAGWDAAGAKWFGYPTFWVNRLTLPVEELQVVPDAVGNNLYDLAKFVLSTS